MTHMVTAFGFAAAITALAIAGHAQTRSTEDRVADGAAIRAHIESIFQAFIDKDVRALEATHGAEWRGFVPGSPAPIRGRDGYMKTTSFVATLPKGQGTVAYRMSDFDVVFYGDTAVASFVAETDAAFGTEKTTQKLTLMDVYHREPTGWIQVASSTSSHPDDIDRQVSRLRALSSEERASVLAAREAVWRTWYAGDIAMFSKLVPPELITIGPGPDGFETHDSVIAASREFAASGAKLTRLAFPRTEFQAYGSTAILYTSYETDVTKDGRTRIEKGVATEVFVQQDGRWLNTAWQLSPTSGR
jgi:ketosteroid isomerase-like protein